MKEKIKNIIGKIINIVFSLFKVQDNKILFESGRGLIDGNAKAIYDYMKDNNIKDYKLIWLVNRDTDVSSISKNMYAFYNTFKGFYHSSTSKYLIKNQSIGSIIKKRDNQVYIQLFHGNGVLKKMGYDVNDVKDRTPLEHTKDWDYYVANDINDKNVIMSSTGYNGKVEILGMACVDNVIKKTSDSTFKDKILNELGIDNKDKKIILYAPTFRDFDLNSDIIEVPIDCLSKLKNYIVIVRFHPLVRDKVNPRLFDYNNIINGCYYSDCSDILAISDMLITDYSSIFYEFLPLNRPIIFYPYDYNKYVSLRGGFYLDYEKELPGPICYNEDELYNNIIDIDKVNKKYNKKRKEFINKYNNLSDGNASKRFVDKLLSGYFSKEK